MLKRLTAAILRLGKLLGAWMDSLLEHFPPSKRGVAATCRLGERPRMSMARHSDFSLHGGQGLNHGGPKRETHTYLNEEECRRHNLTVLDPRATVGQHQRLLADPTSSRRPPPSREAPVSQRTKAAPSGFVPSKSSEKKNDFDNRSHLGSSTRSPPPRRRHSTQGSSDHDPMDEDDAIVHVLSDDEPPSTSNQLRAGLEPAKSKQPNDKGKQPLLEYEEELVGPDREHAILQRQDGCLSPHILVTVRPRVPTVAPPSHPTTLNPEPHRSSTVGDSKPERKPGSNRYNIDLVFKLAKRLEDLGVEVTVSERRVKSSVAYRTEKIESFTSLIADRRERLYSLMCGARDMHFAIRQLDVQSAYTDAALTAIRKDLTSSAMESQIKANNLREQRTSRSPPPPPPPPAPAPTLLAASRLTTFPSVPLKRKTPVNLPPNHFLNSVRKKKVSPTSTSSVDSDWLTDTTTASVGSVSDDDNLLDSCQVVPPSSSSRPKAPRYLVSRPRPHGVGDAVHKTLDVDGITNRLTLLQYRQRRAGSSSPSRKALVLFKKPDTSGARTHELVEVVKTSSKRPTSPSVESVALGPAHTVSADAAADNAPDPIAPVLHTALVVEDDGVMPVESSELVVVDDEDMISTSSTPSRSPSPTLRDLVI
ncbi:hypothetical protein BC829DRAFT_447717 [Chytridium lagenaria]|nr:hypothetical protein BC829DRAFT_447717 [Chytridium lagenaria]